MLTYSTSEENVTLLEKNETTRRASKKGKITVVVCVCTCAVVLGTILGVSLHGSSKELPASVQSAAVVDHLEIGNQLINSMKAENIRNNLKKITAHPHLAGTDAEHIQAQKMQTYLQDVGFDRVELETYNVLLSYPDKTNPNVIELLDGNGDVIYHTQQDVVPLTEMEDQPEVVQQYNAFSAPGNPLGDLVYANYGSLEDFEYLVNTVGIDITDKIVIVRYGKVNRGNKAKYAQQYGAAGLIMYSDPSDYAQDGVDNVYPNTWWMPPTAAQRGSLYINGDPQTPGYPSTEHAYRIPFPDDLPQIPIQPIGYGDAFELLRHMAGETVQPSWKGDLNIKYRYGPGMMNKKWKVQMKISTDTYPSKTHDVIGYIYGDVEPDRYVLVGNHYDAWVYGGVDPSSGTATMMEMARVFGELKQNGWRPRRTIIFCSWGAEEQGIMGSREWVEQYRSILGDRAVAYLNVDSTISGSYSFNPAVMPMLQEQVYDVSKLVPNPSAAVTDPRTSLYDLWLQQLPDEAGDVPKIRNLGSGSDFEPFVSHVGVTSLDLEFGNDPTIGLSSYPLYHTIHDTFEMVEKFMDPEFKLSLSIGQLWGELTRRLASYPLIPFNVYDYGTQLYKNLDVLANQYDLLLLQYSLNKRFDHLYEAVRNFRNMAEDFHRQASNLDHTSSELQLRRFNDQMLLVERAFTDPLGLPGRPLIRHVIFAPSSRDSYAPSVFPALADALYSLDNVNHADDVIKQDVYREIARVIFVVQSATDVLRPLV